MSIPGGELFCLAIFGAAFCFIYAAVLSITHHE